jgi:membrane fusion protein, macrolide-specific efflux system
MLKNKKQKIYFSLLVLIIVVAVLIITTKNGKDADLVVREITPLMGKIESFIFTTGIVKPQNRLEIKPPINGRIEEIKVSEGDMVKAGEVLALMSSTERAALLDAARAQGEESLRHWQEVYRPTPLMAPIDGEVIVKAVESGQTVTSSDVIVVLSDRLIVKAQVDEVDIGRVKLLQKAIIGLDAYPKIKVDGIVDHISYESTIVSNVTIYEVDILPQEIPEVFRSGMSANVEIVEKGRENALIIPLAAVNRDEQGYFVYLVEDRSKKPLRRRIELGISDGENVEVISGLEKDNKILMTTQEYLSFQTTTSSGSPLVPGLKRK